MLGLYKHKVEIVVAFKFKDNKVTKVVTLCAEVCAPVYTRCFTWMPIDTFLEKHKKDKSFAGTVTMAVQCLKTGEHNFIQEDVSESKGFTVTGKRKCTALNSLEFTHALGGPPRQKYARHIPVMLVPSETPPYAEEKVWLFQFDPASQFRSVSLKWFQQSTKHRPVMTASDHLYEQQGDEVYEWSTTNLRTCHHETLPNATLKSIPDVRVAVLKAVGEAPDPAKPERAVEYVVSIPPLYMFSICLLSIQLDVCV